MLYLDCFAIKPVCMQQDTGAGLGENVFELLVRIAILDFIQYQYKNEISFSIRIMYSPYGYCLLPIPSVV